MGKGRDRRKKAKRRKGQGPRDFVAPTGTLRESFVEKERRGDAAEVAFKFSGVPVPFDEKDPSANLREKTRLQKLMADGTKDVVN